MATQVERREATRRGLIESAHELFVERGFEATLTESVLERAGVSRGALYHHFATKTDLFAAVFEHVSAGAVDATVRNAARATSPVEALVAGCLAWLAEARRPEVATILLDQGPSVLGWRRAREIELGHSLSVMRAAVRAARDAGELDVASVDLAAGVLNAVLAEIALVSVHANRRPSAKVVERTLRGVIAGLGTPP